jgi:hypothetical protein
MFYIIKIVLGCQIKIFNNKKHNGDASLENSENSVMDLCWRNKIMRDVILTLTLRGALERLLPFASVQYLHCATVWPRTHWFEPTVSNSMQWTFIPIPFETSNWISTVHIRSCLLSPGLACQYVPCMPWSRNLATQQFRAFRITNHLNLEIDQNIV